MIRSSFLLGVVHGAEIAPMRYNLAMLRKVIMLLGLIVAFLPYIGIPRDITTVLYTIIGLAIFFMLILSKKAKPVRTSTEKSVQHKKSEPPHTEHRTQHPHAEKKERTVELSVRHEKATHVSHEEQVKGAPEEKEVTSHHHDSSHSAPSSHHIEHTAQISERAPALKRRRRKISEVLSDTSAES